MTPQQAKWQDKYVWVTGIVSKSKRMHMSLRPYVGRGGMVLGISKNGQLLVRFHDHVKCIPAGCVSEYGTVALAKRTNCG